MCLASDAEIKFFHTKASGFAEIWTGLYMEARREVNKLALEHGSRKRQQAK
jgi:hypothetical protein